MKDDVFQTIVRQIAAKAQLAELNQITPSKPRRRSTSFTTPYSEWKNHAKIRPANAERQRPWDQKRETNRPFRLERQVGHEGERHADDSAPGTVMSVMSTVFQVVSQNTGSSSMRR